MQNLWGPNVKITLSILSEEGTVMLVCIPPTLAGASPEMWATFPMGKILGFYNWKLIIWRENYATNGERELRSFLASPLTMKRIIVIDANSELLLVSFSRMMRTSITSAEVEIRLPKAWEMSRWVEHSTKSSNHPSYAKSREGDFLGGSLSQRSPCIMVGWTLWSMWATLTREWLCNPRIRP